MTTGLMTDARPFTPVNILIVDDQPSIVRVTQVALGLLGCRTYTARTTADAARFLRTVKVEAIFLDLNLKGKAASSFCRS